MGPWCHACRTTVELHVRLRRARCAHCMEWRAASCDLNSAAVTGTLLESLVAASKRDGSFSLFEFSVIISPASNSELRFLAHADSSAEARVIGRLMPRFEATSTQNIDLFEKMKLGAATLQLSASNPSSAESWDEQRLKEYTYAVTPALDLAKHRGVGMFVDGDGSGGTVVVRVTCGNTARDFAVPLTFKGRQWVEVPSTAAEQGLRVRNWGPVGKGAAIWAGINYSHAIGVAVGVGYLPPNGHSNVTVSGLQALSEIHEPLLNPKITVGDRSVQAHGMTLRTYGHFTLHPDGAFTIYDQF